MTNELAPNRNRGIYLLGHLAVVHDMMLSLLNLGESQFPELFRSNIRTPDDAANDKFAVTKLLEFSKAANANFAKQFESASPKAWF